MSSLAIIHYIDVVLKYKFTTICSSNQEKSQIFGQNLLRSRCLITDRSDCPLHIRDKLKKNPDWFSQLESINPSCPERSRRSDDRISPAALFGGFIPTRRDSPISLSRAKPALSGAEWVEGPALSLGVYPECNHRERPCLSCRSFSIFSEGRAITEFYSGSSGLVHYNLKKGIPIGLFTLSGYKSWR